jgi:hypothetical protein
MAHGGLRDWNHTSVHVPMAICLTHTVQYTGYSTRGHDVSRET